ncbi:hypothetical protein [Truepera radiovictrix]|uniref:Uncharacterized protein n=1 Tax=Truepera radiovictrix (strain DSM 17093 / CIP 108686 / LMG 22925 / RQ-24) TaxID=649638 RepID=D7CRS5_TRURR|nr:hypothetical protein [Truepera radiovictrix]ADI15253.1 hypothetical protein Trad_2140 [Truepera radiovictrix DSM 17093]WMT56195.1 hypothetical protein RCV51_09255 [Truepera radiovictrix]
MNARRTASLGPFLLALALGAAATRLAENAAAFVALIVVFAAALWLLQPKRRALPRHTPRVQVGERRLTRLAPEGRSSPLVTGTTVVCKRITPERQEWVSSRTGRLYDVSCHNGPPNARPGDRGRVAVTATGWRIVPDPVPPDLD